LTTWRPPLPLVAAWFALLALLALTVSVSYVPLGFASDRARYRIPQGRNRGRCLHGIATPRISNLHLCRRRAVLARHIAVARKDGLSDADLSAKSGARNDLGGAEGSAIRLVVTPRKVAGISGWLSALIQGRPA
jgi:hypothetical protein